MRALLLLCFVHTFRSISAVPPDRATDRQTIVVDDSPPVTESLYPSSTMIPTEKFEEDEAEPFATRRSKHRRRRRCRNRNACPRGGIHPSKSLARENEERAGRTSAKDENGSSKIEKTDVYDEEESSSESVDYADILRSSDVYTALDDRIALHEGSSALLTKLFQNLRNASVIGGRDISKELNTVDGPEEDPCQRWLDSTDKLGGVFLGTLASLPACPCQYPSNIFYDDKIWDERQRKHFRWRDVSGDSRRLDVYKPGAAYCVRSLLAQGSGSVAAQHCCYDRRRNLLTRGSGAGTPNFVSPEISPVLHEKIDVLPWRLCKGDFSRYNGARPPNNDNDCGVNPDDEEYQRQIDDTKLY